MIKEKIDLYNKFSINTGKNYLKGDIIPNGLYPMVVMICIQNNKGEFLMQKRHENKEGDWGITGGHPKSGETHIQGIITEVFEGLGLDINNEKLEIFNKCCDGIDCYKMYYLKKY